MGEYAEMMLDGTLCQVCGEFMGGESGYARTCAACQWEDKKSFKEHLAAVERELCLDLRDPYTKVLACAFAWQDLAEERKRFYENPKSTT